MQHGRVDFDDDDLAELWQSAQHRRTEDIYSWLTHFFERQRQSRSSESRSRLPQRRAVALIWKLREAAHTVSRTAN